jgi:hypothetical protein
MRRVIALAVLSMLALPVAIAMAPGQRSVLLRAELLILGACGLRAVTALVARAAGRAPRSALDPGRRPRRPRPVPPASLAALDRRLRLASVHAGDAHHWVRPLVRAIAADRLELRRGLDLDRPGDARVARALGPVAYPLAQAATKRPGDPFGPGIGRDDLDAVVDALEAI